MVRSNTDPGSRGYLIVNERGIWDLSEAHHHRFSPALAEAVAEFFAIDVPAVDLGCGPGRYAATLRACGFSVRAFDGTKDFSGVECLDISQPMPLVIAGQLLCLEVGEHIPREFENVVFGNFRSVARHRALISWAIPGQTGHGHVNERPNEYVIGRLAEFGWRFLPEKTAELRQLDFGECDWFRNTLLAFEVTDAR